MRSHYTQRRGFQSVDTPSFSESTSRYSQNELAATLNYNKRFNDFDVNAILGYQTTQNRSQSISASTVGGLSITDFYSIATSVDRPNYSSNLTTSKVRATYASVSVGYNSIAYLDLSLIHI